MPELVPWIAVATILSLGIFVQAAAGFAAGMLIIPTMLWMGYPIPEASMALLIATVPQNLFGVYSLRDSIEPKRLVWPGLGRVSFLPIGVLVLIWVEQNFPVMRIRQFVGGVVLAVTIATIVYQPSPRAKLHPGWAMLAFPVSGFLQGLVGMGGPAMVFWVTALDWDTRRIRGFLFGMYTISLIPAFLCLYFSFGSRIFDSAIMAALSIPSLLLATWLGLKFGNWLGRERLRRITLGLLLLMGIVGLASPWMKP
ncbi:MAG: sulfite exporter TauE/SafE family protein [Planctomycetota bacterium]